MIEWDDSPGMIEWDEPPKPAKKDSVGRQLGLTGRYTVEGLMGVPAMVYDPIAALVNVATGANIPTLAHQTSQALTYLGLPQPENSLERIVADASRAVAGAGAGIGLASALPNAVALTSEPLAQGLSAATGAAASSWGRENKVSPGGQIALGLMGSLVGGAVQPTLSTMKGTAKGLKAVTKVATKAGREDVAGQILSEMVADPKQAIQRLKHAPIFVPGSKPTTGGLVAELSPLERMLQGVPVQGGRLTERYAAQNAARVALLNKLSHAGVDLDVLNENMSKSALKYLEQAEKEALGKKIDLKPVLKLIDDKLAGPAGKEGASSQALLKVKQLLYQQSTPSSGALEDTFPMVYGVRKGITQILAGKNPEVPGGPYARKNLTEVLDAMDEQIKEAAPTFRRWLSEWARKSQRIERIETIRDIENRTLSSRVQVYDGQVFKTIEPGMWHRVVDRKIADLGKSLTLGQVSGLKRISADLERSALLSRGGMAAGSNTWQNASTAYVIGAALNRKMVDIPGMSKTTSHALAWLVDQPQQQVMELLTDAMLDPKFAAKLMAKATPRNVESVLTGLKRRAIATGVGSVYGQSVTPKGGRSE